MKKAITFITILILIVSLTESVLCIRTDIKVRNWYRTDFKITFIGLPDGTVFGDYIDQKGKEHINEPSFYDPSISGYKTEVEKYYGKVIRVVIDPDSGQVMDYDRLMTSNLVFIGIFLISSLTLAVLKIKKSREA